MQQAKEKIKVLVEKYEKIKSSGKIKSYTEEETKKDLILPLLEALGWNVFDKNEVSAEENIISSGRVDYGIYLNGRGKFYLEAKKLSADLQREEFANQSIRYSWNKGVTWAVLTDFESFKVFNAQEIDKSLADKLLFEIPYTQYLERFDEQLSLLSKEAFEKGLIDKYAEEHGKKLQKISVSTLLYKDLQKARDILTKSLAAWNEKVPKDLLDEGVQKLLDRLIFLRVAEDRGVEPPTLIPMIRQWHAGGRKGSIYKSMIEKFREFDKIYNSNLFSPHPFEDWEEYDNTTEEVVNILYGKKGYYEYDFKAMPADVLGTVYENYLGYRLLQSKKGMTVDKDAKKRKEQGIYYTPTFVVDYIVKNALGPVLAECKSIADLKKIKVLDPACGSGSFLVKVLETINDKYKDFGADGGVYTKLQILTENIYGVDLDEQAVEIARLNLLINALDSKIKLPSLAKNIKNGNSLISGTDEELKKYFGKNFRDKKPFNWQEEFPEVFAQGGFDVIIGNPPYGVELSKDEKDYLSKTYDIGSTDTAILFIKKAFDNLKENGQLGFIIPKAFCFASNWGKIRDYVWDKVKIIIDCGKVWREVKLEQTVIILDKTLKQAEYQSGVLKNNSIEIIGNINKAISKEFSFFLNGVSDEEIKIAQKILKVSVSLNKISSNQRGAILQKEISDEGEAEVIGGAHLSREGVIGIKGKIDKNKINDSKAYINKNSVLVQRIVAHIENPIDHIKIIAALPKNYNQIIVDTINQITVSKEYAPYYIWALLNSKFINWYAYRFIFGKAIRTMQFDNPTTERIPIIELDSNKQKPIIDLAKNYLLLSKQLQETPENSNKWNSIKEEIAKTDKLIDQKVYELYGLGEEEIKIIKDN